MQARNALGAIAGIMLTAGVLAAQATPIKKEAAKPATPATAAATQAKPATPATPATPAATAKSADTTKHMAKKHRKAKPKAKQG